MISDRKKKGFTLIEILVALAITSMISLILLMAFTGITRSEGALKEYSARYRQAIMAMEQISRDVRGIFYSSQIPFSSFTLTEKNIGGSFNSAASFSSFSLQLTDVVPGGTDLISVRYRPVMDDEGESISIIREISMNPQIPSFEEVLEEPILSGIEGFLIEALSGGENNGTREWDSAEKKSIPERVRITIRFTDGYFLDRTLYIPLGSAVEKSILSGKRN